MRQQKKLYVYECDCGYITICLIESFKDGDNCSFDVLVTVIVDVGR